MFLVKVFSKLVKLERGMRKLDFAIFSPCPKIFKNFTLKTNFLNFLLLKSFENLKNFYLLDITPDLKLLKHKIKNFEDI